MVLYVVAQFAAGRCGCDPDEVEMASLLDDLNLSDDDRSELAVLLEAQYMIEIPTDELEAFETVEDLVGYIEDRM